MAGLSTNAPGLWGGFAGLLYGSTSLSTPPGFLADATTPFSPASLFAAAEPGVWYDPSDFSTMFQDSAGTTPVTAVEQPVGLLLDKSQGVAVGSDLSASVSTLVIAGTDAGLNTPPTFYCRRNAGGTINLGAAITGLDLGAIYKINVTVTDGPNEVSHVASIIADNTSYTIGASNTFTIFYKPISIYGNGFRFVCNPNNDAFVTINSIKKVSGNHATQATSASRPVLSARVNLLTYSEQFDNAAWSKANLSVTANAITAPDGTTTADLITDGSAGTSALSQIATVTVASPITHSVYVKRGNSDWFYAQFGGAGTERVRAWFNLSTGAVGTVNVTAPGASESASMQDVGGGWYRCTLTGTLNGVGTTATVLTTIMDGDGSFTRVNNATRYQWGADLRPTNQTTLLPAYQRIAAATDYDTTGFPYYLRFDGTDDSLATSTITPGIDKAQVFSGVRKQSDALYPVLVELSANVNLNNGALAIYCSGSVVNSPGWGYTSKGTVASAAQVGSGYASPITNTIVGLSDISGDRATLFANGAQIAQNTGDQGTGNYLAYPLYIGRRGGTSLPFNGNLYSLIVRFGANLDATTISNTETWVNGKTMAYGPPSNLVWGAGDYLVWGSGNNLTW